MLGGGGGPRVGFMSLFDDMYAATASPLLRYVNADASTVDYIPPGSSPEVEDLEAIVRNERWDVELTASGERRIRVIDISISIEDFVTYLVDPSGDYLLDDDGSYLRDEPNAIWGNDQIHVRGKFRDATNAIWNIRRVVSKSASFVWLECTSRAGHEETRPNLKVPT